MSTPPLCRYAHPDEANKAVRCAPLGVIEMYGMLGKIYHATMGKGFFLHNIPKFPVRCSRLKVSTEITIKLDYPILRSAIVGHNGP
jgi:hypothetical protein